MTLPLYVAETLGEIKTDDGQTFTVTFGLSEAAVQQFTERSCDVSDAELHRFTSDHKRICVGGYETWYAKERYPFALLDTTGTLAGIIWFGPKEFPAVVDGSTPSATQPWGTFAIRLYAPYRGKRLAFPFADFVFKAYAAMHPGGAIWLDTQNENVGAIRLYEKLGFVACGQKMGSDGTEDGRLVMARI